MNCTIPSSGGSAEAEALVTEAPPPLSVVGVPTDVTPPTPVEVETEATPSPPTPEVPTPPSVSGGPSSSFERGCSPPTGLQVSHKSEQGGKEEKTLLMGFLLQSGYWPSRKFSMYRARVTIRVWVWE